MALSIDKDKVLYIDQDEEDEEEPSNMVALSRRRTSISMPTGLDLLVKLAEYSWQAIPPINSSFDDLVEAGVADASPKVGIKGRRVGLQTHVPGRHPGPAGVATSGFYDATRSDDDPDTDDPSSELSEPELSSPRVSLNPSPNSKPRNGKAGKRVSVRVQKVVEDDDDDEDFGSPKKPLSARRKGSIAPIKIHNSNFNFSNPTAALQSDGGGDEEKGQPSPTPSATSISSLLREKLGQMPIPGMFRNKKPKEYKLQAFVATLFLAIILLVGSIYIIHKEKELQKSYYDRIRFASKDRRIRVTNIEDNIVLTGVLGVNLTVRDKPWPCLTENQRENETCLEWMGKARLYLKTKAPPPKGLPTRGGGWSDNENDILCYGIYWESLNANFPVKDCYDMGESRFFYGGGEMVGDQWPLNKTVVPYSPFITGNPTRNGKEFQWGRSLRRFFVNSAGAALQITDETPLFVSINHPDPGQICFGGASDDFGFPGEKRGANGTRPKMPFLNYTICTAENALEITKRLGDKDILDGVIHDDVQMINSFAMSPIWKLRPEILDHGNQSDVALLNHTDKIAAIHPEGLILLDETWQRTIGDLIMDPDRFPNLAETFKITKRRGFRIALTVEPFFSTQSINYVEGLEKQIWVAEREREGGFSSDDDRSNYVPALTTYKKWNSVAVLDVTKTEARTWLEGKVKAFADDYGIESLYADMGSATDLPQHYKLYKNVPSADHLKDMFLQSLRSIPLLSIIGVSSAVKLPKPPTFVSLSPFESSWAGLQTVIPNMLTLGLAGYPFLIPGSIGGDHLPKIIDSDNTTSSTSPVKPDRELYIRWLQLAHFLPVVQYSFLPSEYDHEVVQIAKELQNERKNKIRDFLKKATYEALTTGIPIIRPLWMINPDEINCYKVSDEFAIGDDIIVAPILHPNATERDIYLPKGIWKDEVERSSTKGGRWLHNYKAKHNQIPYFIKSSDASQIFN